MKFCFQSLIFLAAFFIQTLSIAPPLKDASDKKFFASNFPQDTRPVVDKKILDKLKSDKEPYPALQSSAHFENDFVKDENKDAGHWKAQFEYDALRKKVLAEEAEEKKAAERAAKEGKDVDDAKKKAEDASKEADAAKKDEDAAKDGEDAAKKKEAEDEKAQKGEDGKATQKEMEEKLAKAEKKLEEQEKVFAQCQKDLDEAKASVEELKAQVAAMEQKSAADVKLWVEQSDAKKKASKYALEAATAKREAAELRLQVAENKKSQFQRALDKEKAESEEAQKNLQKERSEKDQAKRDLEQASLHLQKLRGYTPSDPAHPSKSGALRASAVPTALLSLLSIALLILS